MSSAKTVGSALATSRTALEDIVRSIAAELRPWKCSERDVLAKVRKTIDGFREDSAHPPDIGYRNENRQTAQDCIEVLNKAEKQLAKLSPEFITSLAHATYFDPTFVVTCMKDWDELERRKDQEAEILSKTGRSCSNERPYSPSYASGRSSPLFVSFQIRARQ